MYVSKRCVYVNRNVLSGCLFKMRGYVSRPIKKKKSIFSKTKPAFIVSYVCALYEIYLFSLLFFLFSYVVLAFFSLVLFSFLSLKFALTYILLCSPSLSIFFSVASSPSLSIPLLPDPILYSLSLSLIL